MPTKKKSAKKAPKRTTSATVKAELKAKGYRLPHGYDVVKRSPAKKKTATKKPVKRK